MPPEPLILGFDTSAAHCAAALLSGDRLLVARHEAMDRGQAERLMPLLEEVLAEAGAGWRDLAALGVGTGPGNFTGVRIAVSAARGLALGLGVPAVGVSGFAVLACGLPGRTLCSLDARRGALHLGVAGEEARARTLDLDALAADPVADWAGLPVAGHAAAEVAALTGGTVVGARYPLAEAIARIAAARRNEAGLPRPAPVYLRPADAAPPADPPPVLLP